MVITRITVTGLHEQRAADQTVKALSVQALIEDDELATPQTGTVDIGEDLLAIKADLKPEEWQKVLTSYVTHRAKALAAHWKDSAVGTRTWATMDTVAAEAEVGIGLAVLLAEGPKAVEIGTIKEEGIKA
jgi:hypothetical protein